ncbi:hypothetical protein LCGC14_0536960 [marine sediment metagenome]|uniref:Uncharacterized protein n=1 Tax=marine sediment metagenome TaxID=412755 RepID=A0A0F9UFD6_9ZZZZ
MTCHSIYFRCSYNNFSCDKYDSATATLIYACERCEHYNDGIRVPSPGKNKNFCKWIKKNWINVRGLFRKS